jgi:hypothetical protein
LYVILAGVALATPSIPRPLLASSSIGGVGVRGGRGIGIDEAAMSCQHDSRRIRATRNAETDDLNGSTGLVQVCSPERACGGMADSDWLRASGFGNVEDE